MMTATNTEKAPIGAVDSISINAQRSFDHLLPVAAERLAYDHDTGIFRWSCNVGTKIKAGQVAGSMAPNGYLVVGIAGLQLLAHRIAFYIIHGYCPRVIDHINRIPFDNRAVNLRAATVLTNQYNAGVRADSSTGIRGVSLWRDREGRRWFRAQINEGGATRMLGTFSDPFIAWLHRVAAAERVHGIEFMRESSPTGLPAEVLELIGEEIMERTRQRLAPTPCDEQKKWLELLQQSQP